MRWCWLTEKDMWLCEEDHRRRQRKLVIWSCVVFPFVNMFLKTRRHLPCALSSSMANAVEEADECSAGIDAVDWDLPRSEKGLRNFIAKN